MKYIRKRLNKPYGFIDYCYYIDDKYLQGILVFMGSFIENSYRRQGKFKELVKELFNMFPKGTEVQVSLSNKVLINFFKQLGFIETEKIEYWGNPENTINLKGFIN